MYRAFDFSFAEIAERLSSTDTRKETEKMTQLLFDPGFDEKEAFARDRAWRTRAASTQEQRTTRLVRKVIWRKL